MVYHHLEPHCQNPIFTNVFLTRGLVLGLQCSAHGIYFTRKDSFKFCLATLGFTVRE